MKIAVLGSGDLYNDLIKCNPDIEWINVREITELTSVADADAYFILDENTDDSKLNFTDKPVFVNSVVNILKDVNTHCIRINGWKSFIENELWELSGTMNDAAVNVLLECKKKYINVPNEPGFITPRILAMIINEAYYALGEGVSDRSEIDTAMKLGTNYPHGPFEWAEIIGIEKIYALLMKLSLTDKRYLPSPALIKQLTK